jgi:hypothetical protein
MSEHDTETFAGFARRFRAIEGEIGDPPPLGWSAGGNPGRPRSKPFLPSTAVIALAMVVAVLSPLLAGRNGPLSGANGSAAGGGATTPSAPASSLSPSPSPSASGLVSLDPLAAPEELPGPCLNHTTVFDRARTTIEQDAAMSSVVVIGTITEIGEAQWNTTDGRAPRGRDIEPSHVLRLLRVKVESVVNGTAPSVVTAWIPGGQIGCHGFTMGGFADAQVGRRYVFFLNETPPRNGISGVSAAWQTWSVEEDSVVTSFEGNVPLGVFVERASGVR